MSKSCALKVEDNKGHVPMFGDSEVEMLKLLTPLIRFSKCASREVIDKWEARGLLPMGLMDNFCAVLFISCTILSAQKAQRLFGVPASVLISMALDEIGFNAQDLAGDQSLLQKCGCCVAPNIDSWFMKRAQLLGTSDPFQEAMPFVNNVKMYVEKLSDLGFWNEFAELKVMDLPDNVASYCLEACDLAAILPAGHYDRNLFEDVRDDAGCVQLKPAMDMREWRKKMQRLRDDSPQPAVV